MRLVYAGFEKNVICDFTGTGTIADPYKSQDTLRSFLQLVEFYAYPLSMDDTENLIFFDHFGVVFDNNFNPPFTPEGVSERNMNEIAEIQSVARETYYVPLAVLKVID